MKFISETMTHLFYKKSQQESDIQKEQVEKGTSFPVLTAIITMIVLLFLSSNVSFMIELQETSNKLIQKRNVQANSIPIKVVF